MMKSIRHGLAAALMALASLAASVAPGNASAFFAWAVADVPQWDTLNVRAWPSSNSRILVAYPNGVLLSMTGKCTGGVNLNAIAGWPAWRQRQAVRSVWCETWVDPSGSGQYRAAWVYGKYIRPA
jgi:G:T/U-mismatch repair DNA glycosylase